MMVEESDDPNAADRRALEAIVGRPLAEDPWPADAIPVGTRVRVIKDESWDGPWREVFTGTIDSTITPMRVKHVPAHLNELEYSVTFDQPQHDTSDDGPYQKAVIWARYLEVL
jgi:hypothetical protein